VRYELREHDPEALRQAVARAVDRVPAAR
jgi:hypothetical protein